MGTDVYYEHGLSMRRIALGYGRGPGYEIHAPEGGTQLTKAEFRRMILILVKHLMTVRD